MTAALLALLLVPLALMLGQLLALASRASIVDEPAAPRTFGLVSRFPFLLCPFHPARWHRPSELALVAGLPLAALGLLAAFTPVKAAVLFVFFALLAWGTVVDLRSQYIPDECSIGGIFAGLLCSSLAPVLHRPLSVDTPYLLSALHGFASSLHGAIVGAGLLLVFTLLIEAFLQKEAMGFGDIKLAAAIGAFLGWRAPFFALFGGALGGLIVMVAIAGWKFVTSADKASVGLPKGHIPFGPMLAGAAVVFALGGDRWVAPFFDVLAALV